MAKIVTSGIAYIQEKMAASAAVNIPTVILANVTGLNVHAEVPDAEVIPMGDIVYTHNDVIAGAVNPDSVVYSCMFDSTMGNFSFNWMGLIGDGGELIAVEYFVEQTKTKTVGQVTGNNLLRNLLLQFANAQTITNVTIDAATWQLDLSGRLNASDMLERKASADLYGDQTFFGAGFSVVENGANLELTAGAGYVQGIRINIDVNQDIGVTTDNVGKDVWLNVHQQLTMNGIVNSAVVVLDAAAQADYVDEVGRQHYLVKIATVVAADITDLRTAITDTTGILTKTQKLAVANNEDIADTNAIIDKMAWMERLDVIAPMDEPNAVNIILPSGYSTFKIILSNVRMTSMVDFSTIHLEASTDMGATFLESGSTVFEEVGIAPIYKSAGETGILRKIGGTQWCPASEIFAEITVHFADGPAQRAYLEMKLSYLMNGGDNTILLIKRYVCDDKWEADRISLFQFKIKEETTGFGDGSTFELHGIRA